MRKPQCLQTIALLFLVVSAGIAQDNARNDGAIIEQAPCVSDPVGTYEQYVEAAKQRYTEEITAAREEGFRMEVPSDLAAHFLNKADFERQKGYGGFQCRRIKYWSDGLKVVGFIWKPKDTDGKRLPLIIFNRGGNREFGKLVPWQRFGFYNFVSHGFVVLASQYRGNDGGEGREEFGGADVHDVMNLIPLAKSLSYVDMNNVFMLGWSRGGMMTYLALKNNISVNAAAVGGGLTDLISFGRKRPAIVAEVYKELISDFAKRGEELMRERSVMYWPEKINVPVLIMQGGADWRADTGDQALPLAEKLQGLGKTYELIIYANDDHGLTLNRTDSDRRIVEWFSRYMKQPGGH